jgi:uncharacterized protein
MKITVSEIPEDGLEIKGETLMEEGDLEAKASYRLRAEKSGMTVLISGEVDAELSMTCSRCLKDIRKEISLPVRLAYSPAEELVRDEEKSHELAPEDLNTGFYSDDELDMGEISKEQVLLNIPIKPLCSESCKGICPRCGADLNEKACGCEPVKTDNRLKALEKYLKKVKE